MPPLTRRHGLAALLSVATAPAFASPERPEAWALMVAGPPGGRVDQWAAPLSRYVGQGLPGRAPLQIQNVGGIDGVTGANQFEARGEPDGKTALLVPGTAALSWLVGEMRARFDPARWVPIWADIGSVVLVSRSPLVPGRTLAVAAPAPVGPELPALLALDLCGISPVLTPRADAEAFVIRGAKLPQALAAASSAGFKPVFTLGTPGPDGDLLRDPLLPNVPIAMELIVDPGQPALLRALQAASSAVQLDAGLVLPALSPAAAVSLWRRACAAASQDPEVGRQADLLETRIVASDAVGACTSSIAGNAEMLLALRRWLQSRFDWQPA